MKALALPAVLLILAAGCRGMAPKAEGAPGQGMSAVLLGARAILPSGESRAGVITLNLEGDAGRQIELDYRLDVEMKQPNIFEVEPGVYRLTPARSIFGNHQPTMTVNVEGARYRLPFPRDILRLAALTIRPGKVVTLGVLEARLAPSFQSREPAVKVRLDDTLATRRALVQQMIKNMMDPALPLGEREHAIAWSHALQTEMVQLESEAERTPLYKSSP